MSVMNLKFLVEDERTRMFEEAAEVLSPFGVLPMAGGAIVAADIKYRLSGGAANSDVNAALGGAKSSVDLVDNTDNNLFDDVTGAQHTAGHIDYRCIYIHNGHGSLTLTGAVVWIASDTTGSESDLSIAVGTAAVNGTEQTVGNETTAPSGVSWSDAAVSRATGLALGDLPFGQHKAVWLRRTITAGSTPQAVDTCSIQAGGDTL